MLSAVLPPELSKSYSGRDGIQVLQQSVFFACHRHMRLGWFTALHCLSEPLIIRRSFELFSLYLLPIYRLNLFLGPFVIDSKPREESSSKTRSSKNTVVGDSGSAAKQVISPDRPVLLRVKSSRPNEPEQKEEDTPLTEFVRKHCTSLFEKWEPTWWLKR